jgi:hypothetical protein
MSCTQITNAKDLYHGKVYSVNNHMLRYKGQSGNILTFSPTVYRSVSNLATNITLNKVLRLIATKLIWLMKQ